MIKNRKRFHLKNFFKKIFSIQTSEKLNNKNTQKKIFINAFTIASFLALSIYSLIYFFNNKFLNLFFLQFLTIVLIFNIFYLRKTNNIEISATILLSGFTLLCLFLFINGGYLKTGIYWYYIFPLTAFFLKGIKKGGGWLFFLYFATVMLLVFDSILQFNLAGFSLKITLIVLGTLILESGVVIFYEFVRNISMNFIEKENVELSNLNKVLKEISSSLDFEEVFNKISNYLFVKYGFEGCLFFLINSKNKTYYLEKSYVPENLKKLILEFQDYEIKIEKNTGWISDCILQKTPVFYTKLAPKKIKNEYNKATVEIQKMKTILNLPVFKNDKVFGVFSLTTYSQSIDLPDETIHDINRFINYIVVIINNSMLHSDLEKKSQEIENIFEMSKYISSSLDLEKVYYRIIEYLMETYGFEGAGLAFVCEDRKNYNIRFFTLPDFLHHLASMITENEFPLNEKGGRAAECMLKNKTFYSSVSDTLEIRNEASRNAVEMLNIKSALHIPLSIDNEVIGAIALTSHTNFVYLNDNKIKRIQRLINQFTIILKNSKLYDEILKERSFSKSLVDNSPFAIIVLNRKGKPIYINKACEILLGYNFETYKDLNIINFPSIKNAGLDQCFEKALNGITTSIDDIIFFSSAHNKEYILNFTFTPVKNTDNVVNTVLSIFYDNTDKALAQKKIQYDMMMAKGIQKNLISNEYLNYADLKIFVKFSPMMEVGGDIYDIFKYKDNYYRIFIADATGHGVQAALKTMIIKTEYDKLKSKYKNPKNVIFNLNNIFIKNYLNIPVLFTCSIADIDLEKRRIIYSCAGQPDQFIIKNNQVENLYIKESTMIGLVENYDYKEITKEFSNNEKLFLFTDGIFEIFSSDEKIFGEDNLKSLVEKNAKLEAEKIMEQIMLEIGHWGKNKEQNDDITAIFVQLN